MKILSRVPEPVVGAVALETTLLVHGVPRDRGAALGRELAAIVRAEGAFPALVGVVAGRPTVGMTEEELGALMGAGLSGSALVAKANTANLGVLMHRGQHAATTVSTTMELTAHAGVRVFATGGIGGVHEGYGSRLDVSADLAAFTRFPVAVVTSGVKSILDVESTREALETLGVPVIGFGTDRFPAFYRRGSGAGVDARIDDVAELAAFVARELARTGRGIVIANPIPESDEIPERTWTSWLERARADAAHMGTVGRDVTPAILASLHKISGGATLAANISLVRSNTKLAAGLASSLGRLGL